MDLHAEYPFISFAFSTSDLSAPTWFLLGEAMSKCQHLAGTPLKPAAAADLAAIYLARGVLATTAIEGNTLSEEQADAIVREGTAHVPPSRQYQEREIQNVLAVVREIDEALTNGDRLAITPERLRYLNARVLDGLPEEPEVVPGEFRDHRVGVGTYRPPGGEAVPQLVDQFCTWLAELRGAVNAASREEDRFTTAILAAILAHLYIAWIHPFGNGNGRTARLVEVQILSESGVVPLVATNLLSDHYNKTREAYYRSLNLAQRSVADFVSYAVQGLVDELRAQIATVRIHGESVHWESLVYETFRAMPNTAARDRQRSLALAMPEGRSVTARDITELTPGLARQYALAGERTPARDLNDLVKLNLASKTGPRRYEINRAQVRAFMPPVASYGK